MFQGEAVSCHNKHLLLNTYSMLSHGKHSNYRTWHTSHASMLDCSQVQSHLNPQAGSQ